MKKPVNQERMQIDPRLTNNFWKKNTVKPIQKQTKFKWSCSLSKGFYTGYQLIINLGYSKISHFIL